MITYVLRRLAVGSSLDARRPPEQLSAILNVAEECETRAEGRLSRKIPLRDLVPISPENLSEAIVWIKDHIRHHGVLVCCNAGIGRSPSVAIAYLCSIGFGYDEAFNFVSARLPEITPVPNLAFSIEETINFFL
ncbi:MAG: dual specificity protein phosphatase [bacterium]|nr:dual specificity protein phosphatase [bacterium]